MDYAKKLQYHYRPKKGWVNDPNGLVYFNGYYHVFYQHAPDFEIPWQQPMHWGNARTKDFLHWEELPVALYPDREYDNDGCFSGTAIVKDDTLYLFYASIFKPAPTEKSVQTVSVAYSRDGVHFEKYAGNPVIPLSERWRSRFPRSRRYLYQRGILLRNGYGTRSKQNRSVAPLQEP